MSLRIPKKTHEDQNKLWNTRLMTFFLRFSTKDLVQKAFSKVTLFLERLYVK